MSLNIATLPSSIGMLPYLPCFFISVYIYNNYSVRVGYGVATVTCLIGGWVRQIAQWDQDRFWWIILG